MVRYRYNIIRDRYNIIRYRYNIIRCRYNIIRYGYNIINITEVLRFLIFRYNKSYILAFCSSWLKYV